MANRAEMLVCVDSTASGEARPCGLRENASACAVSFWWTCTIAQDGLTRFAALRVALFIGSEDLFAGLVDFFYPRL